MSSGWDIMCERTLTSRLVVNLYQYFEQLPAQKVPSTFEVPSSRFLKLKIEIDLRF